MRSLNPPTPAIKKEQPSAIFIHARDKEGKITGSKEVFQDIDEQIRAWGYGSSCEHRGGINAHLEDQGAIIPLPLPVTG